MLKGSLKVFGFLFLVFLISGCTARAYTHVRQRVDQETVGNAGYLYGTPPPQDRSSIRKTRKTYVLEIQKKDKKEEQALKEVESSSTKITTSSPQGAPKEIPQEIPATEKVSPLQEEPAPSSVTGPSPEESTSLKQYTVEKGDTLQKISKKFYNTYRKWSKIYDANKDKIKNPNNIKAGTILTIPKE